MSGQTNQATVLIVEDDPGVIRLQQIRLERAGYQVRVATTADQALALVREGTIDLMLLDQQLPGGVTGLDLYRQVKKAGLDIPAILVTGFASDSIVLESFRAGVYDFVPKTADYMDYLLPTIERVLEKRRTEFQLVESEARLAGVINSALDAVLTVDEDHRIVVFNPAAEQIFGLTGAEAQGRPIQGLLPAWDKVQRPGVRQHWETVGVRASGERFPIELSTSWMETNRRRSWTCVARDITERKAAQEERERLIQTQAAHREAQAARDRLEKVARENKRLYQELRQVDRLKDEFLAMLAHELRNPLAPIRNSLELIRLQSDRLPAEIGTTWGIIDRQVSHLIRLVDDLLDVNRISEGKIQLQRETCEVANVVERAVESSQPWIEARRHALEVRLPRGPLYVEGDVVRLVQVLANLLNNAAKYTPEGGRIEIRAEKEGGVVAVRVKDTGVGIPGDMVPRLFNLFTQSERTLDRSEGGLGIGLTLVKRLTEMHGGSVEVSSEGPGKGSEFTVRLPLREAPPPEAPRETRAAAAAAARPAARGEAVVPGADKSRRILVVDDNEDSARTLARLLTILKHEVHTASDGPGALAAAEEFRPEVILLDIGLPGMDGYQVARRFRSNPEFNRTLLVALTGYGSPEDRRESAAAGFNAHLVKPVDLNALRAVLARPEELLELRTSGVDSPPQVRAGPEPRELRYTPTDAGGNNSTSRPPAGNDRRTEPPSADTGYSRRND